MQVDLYKAELNQDTPEILRTQHMARFEADDLKAVGLLAFGTAMNFGPGFYCVTDIQPLCVNGDGTVDLRLHVTFYIPRPDEETAQVPLDDLLGSVLDYEEITAALSI